MRIQRQINASVSIRSVQRSILGIFVNLVRLDELEGLQNDKSKPPPKRVWGHTYSVIGEENCTEKADGHRQHRARWTVQKGVVGAFAYNIGLCCSNQRRHVSVAIGDVSWDRASNRYDKSDEIQCASYQLQRRRTSWLGNSYKVEETIFCQHRL